MSTSDKPGQKPTGTRSATRGGGAGKSGGRPAREGTKPAATPAAGTAGGAGRTAGAASRAKPKPPKAQDLRRDPYQSGRRVWPD
jgi:hypothetical protein